MAKHVIIESYTFTPATRTIVVTGRNIRREQLLLITNTTTGTVIYNFSDPSLGATSLVNSVNVLTGLETTNIVVSYNTTSMNATDKIAILVEESYTEITPSEVLRDPVDKLRVSNPQSLIDTDFEYGTQPTKWESNNLLNNRPSAFYDATVALTGITNITASGRLVTITTSSTTGIVAGTPFFITGTLDTSNADGWWIAETVVTNTSITFNALTAPAAALWDATKTYVFPGNFFTGAGYLHATSAITVANTTTVTVTTTNAHGLRVGDSIFVRGTTGSTGGPVNGSWIIATTPTNNTFTYTTIAAAGGTPTVTAVLNASIYPRPYGFIEHRPFDGGVQFSNETPYHGYQVIRQTRRYFRYQSGKGVQFSTGSVMKPPLYVDNVTSSGTTVTVTTRYPHGLLPGAQVRVVGCDQTAYNGTFAVATAANAITFTYTALSVPAATPATGFPISISPNSWYGGSNRVGMFDSQNGFFFEFDGQTLYAVRRSSTAQISGRVAVTVNSDSVVGTATKFSSQLRPGDAIVIRGMTYFIKHITSDTQMYVSPEYRGVTTTNCMVSKTIDTRFAQNTWNIDKCDGTGVSNFNLDLTKMQMFYMDYTWYGAGAIRFGFKNNRGEVFYCHRIPNSNINTEAYMRSGNLPARYETNTLPALTQLTSTLSSASTTGATIAVADTSLFPPSGTVAIYASAVTGAAIEYITYSAKTATTLTIAARAQAGGAVATTFTFSATSPITVQLHSPQTASTISHWGSAVIMDGRFDDDKSFVFQGGMTTALTNIGAGARVALMSLRLAPAVDNGITGLLGVREIINRMQLTMRSMGAFVTGATMAFRIEIILNGRVSAGTFIPVGGSSLAQIAYHTGSTTVTGGETIFSFFVSSGGSVTSQDLNLVRDLGNSILGGGTSLTAPTTVAGVYPDGPDLITITATNVTAVTTNSINARISWTEAQA
jgi:hypothetical protein